MIGKKPISIILAVVGVIAVILVAIGVKVFIIDAKTLEINEFFEDISWDKKADEAKNLLELEGYNFKENSNRIFEVENFGGYEGANGEGKLVGGINGVLKEISLEFQIDEMGENEFDEFVENCIETLDETFDEKVPPDIFDKLFRPKDESLTEMMYYGMLTCFHIKYYEDSSLTIIYNPIDDSYCQRMLDLKNYFEHLSNLFEDLSNN